MAFSFFPAFFDRPRKVRFVDQEPGEQIELLLRQHWFTNLSWVLAAVFAALLPVLLPALKIFELFTLPFALPGDVTFALSLLWYMLIMAYVLEKFLFWYFNIYLVTDQRLIDVVSHTLLSRDTTTVFLSEVQSARAKVRGVGGLIFNYGDVIIETAARQQSIEFLGVPKPDLVADRIHDLRRLKGFLKPGEDK
ncbi:PH domain-containing protein [candidate division WS5 bacterium]|uniref:PH domain-containing protein n=1 Tax=candidate division WS5 bacterium TaxID=2093353 RepID=A0A419DDL4_9BACT|nr:MAG: PH domain-containing protein [candidate division WS5 bacterium]